MAIHNCRNCGADFEVKTKGRPPAYCGDSCRAAAGKPPKQSNISPGTVPSAPPSSSSNKEVYDWLEEFETPKKQADNASDETPVVETPIVEELKKELPQESFLFEVSVGNGIGVVHRGNDFKEAEKKYKEYEIKVWQGYGSLGYEKLSLSSQGKLIKSVDPRQEIMKKGNF